MSSVLIAMAEPMSDTVAVHANRLLSSLAVKRRAWLDRCVRYIIWRRPGSPVNVARCSISDNWSLMSTYTHAHSPTQHAAVIIT